MEKGKCRSCKGINNSLTGDYCLGCIADARPGVKVPLQVQPQESYDEWRDRTATYILDKLDRALGVKVSL